MSASKISESASKIHGAADLNSPGILPFLPMLYIAWADGILTPTEISSIRDKIHEQPWIEDHEKAILNNWLDPGSPPSTTQVLEWLRVIRHAGKQIPLSSKLSLTNLGQEIARIGARDNYEKYTSPEASSALAEIEAVLGIAGTEAAHALLTEHVHPVPAKPAAVTKPTFNLKTMRKLLDGEHATIRNKVRTLLSDPMFRYEYGIDKNTYRERVLAWCRELAKQGLGALSFPKAYGGKNDLAGFVTVFETLAFHDLSLAVKFGVQFGLFGGSIFHLGTKTHHENYLKIAGSLELPGCFAMTELGHGSNVKDIETIATYDREKKEFVIHTPVEEARKDYIGNAAMHGQMATVFAQLEIDSEPYGVHAFLVPIRDKNGIAMPGVRLEDCGEKMGLNGVDNGRIWFKQVRIPRENLLDRFAQVSSEGNYSSSIASTSKRFFTMLSTLIGGRVSVAAASLSATKSALTIAIRYALHRRQFGESGENETLLLDYPSHQRRLLPKLATAYALDFAIKYLIRRYAQKSEQDSREVEVLAAALKAYCSWYAIETIQECRESCGGKGYLAENRFADLKADTEIFTTFEGDNTVLMQLVAKGLLTEFKHQFNDMKFFDLVKYLAEQAGTTIAEMNPIVTRITDESHLRDPEFQLGAFRYRESHLLTTVAQRLKKRIDDGMNSYHAFIACQNHLLALAYAHTERIVLEQFLEGIANCTDRAMADMLKQLCDLFALSRIEKDKGWFLESGYIESGKAKAIRKQVDKLCLALKPQAVHLVDVFGIPDSLLAAPIGVSESL